MFKRLRAYFQPIQVRSLPLKFEMDVNEEGKHVVRIFVQKDQEFIQVQDVQRLWDYGFLEESSDHQIFTIKEEDLQNLFALKSLNPEITEDGELIFEIEPPVLSFLRKKKNIQETSAAQEVIITDQPLRPTAKVEFHPGMGMSVKTGYAAPGKERLIQPEEIKTTKDGKYARVDNVFAPIAGLSDKAKEILNRPMDFIGLRNIPEFIQRDLVLIKKEFNAVLTDLAKEVRVVTEPLEPVVHVTKDSQGWLNFNVSYNAAGFVLPHGLIAEKKDQKYFQVGPSIWVKLDQKIIQKTEEELQELNATFSEGNYRVPVHEFANLEDFISDIGGRSELNKAYREFLDQLTGFDADERFRFSEQFENHLSKQKLVLRPYQRAGAHWLSWLQANHLHGILADDMGLGKTLQSLCVLRYAYELNKSEQHSLIIAPKSVLYHWERELRRCFPQMRHYIYHGTNRRKGVLQSATPHVIITTYDTVVRDIDDFAKVPFFYLILDEATRIKNPDALRAQAVKALNAAHRLALSGTPVENRPTELWSLFDFLMRGHLGRHGTFVHVFEGSIMAGDQRAANHLGRRIQPFLLRRKKEEVAKDLPEKIVIHEWCTLTFEQKQLYGGLQDEMKRIREALHRGEYVNYTANILPVLTRLKQICGHPALITKVANPLYDRSEKFDWIIKKIQEIVQSQEQVVVFSHFLGMLNLMERAIQEKGIRYIRIDGSTNDRQALIDHFNLGRAKVALLSIMAAGHGINLAAANHVIHADRWWNPAVEDQATDRVHRIGQDKTVFVYHIMVESTLEERIDRLLENKRGIAEQIISAAVKGEHQWSREELIELLRPLD